MISVPLPRWFYWLAAGVWTALLFGSIALVRWLAFSGR
jgi:hypothetical protein